MGVGQERFGPFVLIEELGQGGHGSVHLARLEKSSGFEKLIALKRIHPNERDQQERVRQLVDEAKLAARIQHPNVVQVFDLGEIDGEVFVAMEFVRGKNIAAILRRAFLCQETVPLSIAVFIASELITALDYVHRAQNDDGSPSGIIHGDVSPHNVLVSYEGSVKVTDFGIARIEAGGGGFFGPDARLGKAPYVAPEQLDGHIDQRSDIFSTGVVIFELLTGRRLFPGKNLDEVISRVATQPIPPPSKYNDRIPPALDDVCAIALRRDIDSRFQNSGELLAAFDRAAKRVSTFGDRRALRAYMQRLFKLPSHSFGRRSATADLRVEAVDSSAERLEARVLDGLVVAGVVSRSDLAEATNFADESGRPPSEILLFDGIVAEALLLERFALEAGLEVVDDAELRAVPAGITRTYPRAVAERAMVIPIRDDRPDGPIVLAASVPYRPELTLEARVLLGAEEATVRLASRSAIRDWIARVYQATEDIDPSMDLPETADVALTLPVVLLADRDVALTDALVERLANDECEVCVAADGKLAGEILRERSPVVSLIDAALPGVDGFTLLLEHRARRQAGTIFITSSRDDEFRQAKALELGADDFISKPPSLTVLTSKIRREVHRAEDVGAPRPAAPAPGVRGATSDMSVVDIVRVLEMGHKSAHVVIDLEGRGPGEVAVVDGRVTGVRFEDQVSVEAFKALARAPEEGTFHIVYGLSALETNVHVSNTALLMDAEDDFEFTLEF